MTWSPWLNNTQVWQSQTRQRLQSTLSPDCRAFPAIKAAELTDALMDVVDEIELESSLANVPYLRWMNVLGQYRCVCVCP